jgi:hypothetical protein
MKIVQGDEQPILEARNIRTGKLDKQYILTGDSSRPGNFVFGLYYQTGDFYSPRHHHNFDQWRFQLEGDCGFDKNGTMKPGVLGYFPEGAYYGPQTSDGPNVVALLQFAGPSGARFLSQDQVYAAFDGLKAFGRVERGVFYRDENVPGPPGLTDKKTLDSFQATWEFANEQPLVFPKPQYADPVLIDTTTHRWMPLDGAGGVEEKAYGSFTDCAIRAASYRLAPGSTLRASGRGIYFVLSGAGTVESEPFRTYTALYLEHGENATFRAAETSEILLMGLPEVARMRRPVPALEADLVNA